MGGYSWKVFGNNIIADAVDLKTINYTSDNTIVSKPNELLTLSTTEKFSIQEINFLDMNTSEKTEALIKNTEASTYFGTKAPELEGTYLCMFKFEYYGKGYADYAVKVVVTDENIYDVKDIIRYSNTNDTDIIKIKEILSKLPYANELNGISINTVDASKNININYNNNGIKKEDLLNSSIALFALIPEVDIINYNTLRSEQEIIYTRDEVNNLMNRNILEYANDSELWLKEVIYKEKNTKISNAITMYTSAISSSLANLTEKEIGKYIAIDITKNNVSGDIMLNQYDVKELLNNINKEYENILLVDANEFENTEGTIIYVILSEKIDEVTYIVDVKIESAEKQEYNFSYKIRSEIDAIAIEPNVENSGDQE